MVNDIPQAQISDMGQLTEVVPYLLGFTPHESMVLIATVNGRIEVTARADLADVQPAGELEFLTDRINGRFPDATVLALAYTEHPDTGWELLRRTEAHLGQARVPVRMLVTGDTWYKAEGSSGAIDRDGPIATQVAKHGLTRAAQRADLADRFHSPELTNQLRDTLLNALDSLPPNHAVGDQLQLSHQLISRHAADGGTHIQAGDAARLAVLTHLPAAAHLAMGMIERPHDARQHLALWTAVVNQLPQRLTETPLQLAALAAWAAGEGALSTVAIETADQVRFTPSHTPVRTMVDLVNQHVMPPSMWGDLRDALVTSADPRVRALIDTDPTISQPQWEMVQPPSRTQPHPEPAPPLGRPANGPAL